MYLSIDELAARYGVSANTVRKWKMNNKGPRWTMIEGSVRYAMQDVLEYELNNKIKSGVQLSENC